MMYSFTNIDLTSVFMCFDDQDLPADLESNHIPSFSESKGCKIYSPPARYCGSVEKDYIRIAFGTPNPQENLLLEHGLFFLYVLQKNFLQIGTEHYPRSHGSKVSFDHEKHMKTATFHRAHPHFQKQIICPAVTPTPTRSTPLRARAFDEEPQAFGDGF